MDNLSIWIIIRRLRWPMLVIIITFSISILGMVLIPGVDDKGNVYHLNFFDAFYFVSYMASTIGFGESPYAFTYPQKLWVSASVYATVIGWFYGIGTIVSLMQDKVLALELSRARFVKSIKNFREPFILIFGYNNITKKLIDKLNKDYKRMVIIDKSQDKIDALALENYYPYIPGFVADAMDTKMLELVGVTSKKCQAVIIVFEDDHKNTTIAMKCRYLNPNISLFVKSSSIQNNEYLNSIGVNHVENPFKVISDRLRSAIMAPHIWLLESWIYGKSLKFKEKDKIPHGKCIIYGYGRMGAALEDSLKQSGLEYKFIDSYELFENNDVKSEIYSNQIMESELIAANIQSASIIIAATRDDMINLAVITIAKNLNPTIYTIARENELEDINMFQSAQIDRNYILEGILTDKIYTYISMPLANDFIKLIHKKDEKWGQFLVQKIVSKLGYNPHLYELTINQHQTNAVYEALMKKEKITIGTLKRSRENYKKNANIVFLMVERKNKKILLPDDSFEIQINDKLMAACNEQSEVDLAYILNNYYELYYVMHGKEKISGVLGLFQSYFGGLNRNGVKRGT